jgi:hypothetical protein
MFAIVAGEPEIVSGVVGPGELAAAAMLLNPSATMATLDKKGLAGPVRTLDVNIICSLPAAPLSITRSYCA